MTEPTKNNHDWNQAGEAWGHSAIDWACLYEHYAVEVIFSIFGRLGISTQTDMLDIACGAGLTLRLAESMGTNTAGIDASASLLNICRDRNPNSDVRFGSMFELPWQDNSFDAITSINGIWGGCEAALVEALRVLRPGGKIGISFWGNSKPNDLREYFKVIARHAPAPHFGDMKELNNIATPGVAEEMLTQAGFEVLERGSQISTIEWPDEELAWRGLSSTGPAVPALQHSDPAEVKKAVLAAIEPCRDSRGMYRFRNDHQFVIAHLPA